MSTLSRALLIALGTSLVAAPSALAEAAVWLDAEPDPAIEEIGRALNVRLFNDELYDVPFYRAPAGARVTLFGEVLADLGGASPNSTVYIYAQKKGEPRLTRVGQVRSGRFGRFTYRARAISKQTAYVAFAVGNPGRAGDQLPAISNPVFARVAPKIVTAASISSSGRATIRGKIAPTTRGTVSLYLLNGRKPTRVGRQAIGRRGAFSFGLEFDASGTYDFSLVVKPKPSTGYVVNARNVSVRVAIPVPAPPPPAPTFDQPAEAAPPPPSAGEATGGFGGSCTAFGCSAPVRAAQLAHLAELLAAGAEIPISALPKPTPAGG